MMHSYNQDVRSWLGWASYQQSEGNLEELEHVGPSQQSETSRRHATLRHIEPEAVRYRSMSGNVDVSRY